jgi:hypothetical protein
MSPGDLAGLFLADQVDGIAEFCRKARRRFVTIDGFAGTGKSTFAEALAERLERCVISLDEYLPDDPDSIFVQSYVGRLNRASLAQDVAAAEYAIIEGVLLNDALAELVPRDEVTALYFARCSHPTASSYIWHDGVRIEDGDSAEYDGAWFMESELEYHRRAAPHLHADGIVVRVADD